MYLLTSASYSVSELQSEFGSLPSCFLPVGNKRLFHYQLDMIPPQENIVITLPEDFIPDTKDIEYLSSRGVNLLYLPVDLTLGQSVVYAINLLEIEDSEVLYLVHGDTFFEKLPLGADLIGISLVEENYDWAEYCLNDKTLRRKLGEYESLSDYVANGFFSFSSPKALVRHITRNAWSFIDGLNDYIKCIGLNHHICQGWFDFGHLHTYYQSKTKMTTQRSFNNMCIKGLVVTKSSHKKYKLAAEANWYRTLPAPLRTYIPQFLGESESQLTYSYSIEYLHLTALNELYVFGRLPNLIWKKIFRACIKFLQDASLFEQNTLLTLDKMFVEKTCARLREFQASAPFDLEKKIIINGAQKISVFDLYLESIDYLPADSGRINVLHGDFCFSNILYDFRTGSVKVIDPRGIDADDAIFSLGNTVYDVSKLAHSVVGLYDFIIAGYFHASIDGEQIVFDIECSPNYSSVVQVFFEMLKEYFNLEKKHVYAMQIHLFLSMLPLHDDRPDRQLAFIANAYRLYDELCSIKGEF